ncbi:U-box domain-containing protein [Colletotrichum lupini]|uniref:U-box domain-containing protein n=1 Tax=Colletotrichum lupini TaxID=145971 RepID=A0A9Q8SG24_9PEZI|nr:U-box domain-containing protein [Colletotrichum lupini]UQC76737.1 U-box domain-containing protein [Colletotrichum lupini]
MTAASPGRRWGRRRKRPLESTSNPSARVGGGPAFNVHWSGDSSDQVLQQQQQRRRVLNLRLAHHIDAPRLSCSSRCAQRLLLHTIHRAGYLSPHHRTNFPECSPYASVRIEDNSWADFYLNGETRQGCTPAAEPSPPLTSSNPSILDWDCTLRTTTTHCKGNSSIMSRSIQLKEEGNRHFQQGDYAGAEALYSKAIIADPKNPALYTNRAMARLKLEIWDSVVSDCESCLGLTTDNLKAHYYLSQAQLALKDYDSALTNAQKAHQLCVQTGDKSLAAITAQVLRAKKDRWDWMEKRRTREARHLENEVIELMEKEREQALTNAMDDGEKREIEAEWEQKIEILRSTFEKSRSAEEKRREVPEWAIDDISFGIMVDPVLTKTGKSYERASIMEHLRRHPSDPLTREPLLPSELRPNLGLRQACEEFLEENGWAVDCTAFMVSLGAKNTELNTTSQSLLSDYRPRGSFSQELHQYIHNPSPKTSINASQHLKAVSDGALAARMLMVFLLRATQP